MVADKELIARVHAVRMHAAKRENWARSDWSTPPSLAADSPFLVEFTKHRCWFRHLIDPNEILWRHLAVVVLPDTPFDVLQLGPDGYTKVAVVKGRVFQHASPNDVVNLCIAFGFDGATPNSGPAEDWGICQHTLPEPYLHYGRLPLTEVIQAIGPASDAAIVPPLPTA